MTRQTQTKRNIGWKPNESYRWYGRRWHKILNTRPRRWAIMGWDSIYWDGYKLRYWLAVHVATEGKPTI